MKINKLVSNLLESNTFILENDDECLVIDCGCELEAVKDVVGNKKVMGILLTHGHFDHSAHCNEYASYFNCKLYASEEIKATLTDKIAIYNEDYSIIKDISKFIYVKDEENLKLGGFDIKCYAFPGHCPCAMGFLIDNNLFAGDFLFAKSFGRVDLKNGNKEEMLASLNKLENIDFETLYSGHGEESTKEDQLRNLKLYKRFLTR